MAQLTIRCGSHSATLTLHGQALVGRAPECAVSVHDATISRRHCRIDPVRGGWEVVDLGSRNGTLVNGERVERRTLLDGDEVVVGSTVIRFRVADMADPDPTPLESPTWLRRPSDPFEAMAGTVFAYEMDELRDEPASNSTAAIRPRPRPPTPGSYQTEGVGTLVLEMLSDWQDTDLAARRRRQVSLTPRPRVRIRPVHPPAIVQPSLAPTASHPPRRLEPLDWWMAGLTVCLLATLFAATRALLLS